MKSILAVNTSHSHSLADGFCVTDVTLLYYQTCHACYDTGEATAGFHPSWEPLEKQFTVSVSSVPAQQQQYLTATNPKHHLHNNRYGQFISVDIY